jgi:hypothetical protein
VTATRWFAFATSFLYAGTALAQSAEPAPPVVPPESSPGPPSSSPVTTVSLDAPPAVSLERETGQDSWSLVCTAPCSTDIARDGVYRVIGSGIRTSHRFVLRAPDGLPERLVVKPASTAQFTVGIVVGFLGVAALGTGFFVLPIWILGDAVENGEASVAPGASRASLPPWIPLTIGTGAVLAFAGMVLVLNNRQTRVEQVFPGSAPQPELRPGLPPRIHGDLPEPTGLPSATLVPIFAHTF